MLLCFAIAAGVVIGLARGGRLTRLATLRLRCSWLVVPPLVMQLSLILAPRLSDTLVSPPVPRRKVFSAGDVLVGGGLALLGARTLGSRRSAAPSNASVAPPFPLRARRGRSGQG